MATTRNFDGSVLVERGSVIAAILTAEEARQVAIVTNLLRHTHREDVNMADYVKLIVNSTQLNVPIEEIDGIIEQLRQAKTRRAVDGHFERRETLNVDTGNQIEGTNERGSTEITAPDKENRKDAQDYGDIAQKARDDDARLKAVEQENSKNDG